MRGEKEKQVIPCPGVVGSSPRAWGKAGRHPTSRPRSRIIPTCVGKRGSPARPTRKLTDHPHVRGEKTSRHHPVPVPVGSSPRAWGKVCPAWSRAGRPRIIPTCVGKRLSLPRAGICPADHPHVRGEKNIYSMPHLPRRGSSPRAWGKGMHWIYAHLIGGIIPTCVGKSGHVDGRRRSDADHPHVRGEKSTMKRRVQAESGSSPRAWGKGCGEGCGS